MKNLFENSDNESVCITNEKQRWNTYVRKIWNNIIVQADTLSIISIMLGGLIAIGKDSRAIGVGIVVAGFAGLLFQVGEKISAHK